MEHAKNELFKIWKRKIAAGAQLWNVMTVPLLATHESAGNFKPGELLDKL